MNIGLVYILFCVIEEPYIEGLLCVILKEMVFWGRLGGSMVGCLPLAQGMILESRDQVPHGAPCMEPASPSACVSASLSVCVSHE